MSSRQRFLAGFVVAGFLWVGCVHGESPDQLSVGVGVMNWDVSYSGTVGGSLSPVNRFAGTASSRTPALSVGYGRQIWKPGPRLSLEFDASLEYQNVKNGADRSWAKSVQQTVDTCYPPPPFVPSPAYCVSFGTSVRTFTEAQQIHADIAYPLSAQGKFLLSYEIYGKKLWAASGPVLTRRKVRWSLPATTTFQAPIPSFITVGIPPLPTVNSSLPAQVSLPGEAGLRHDWVWSAGFSLGFDQPLVKDRKLRFEVFDVKWQDKGFSSSGRLQEFSIATDMRGLRLTYLF